jgi:hypothetical protein
LGSNDFSGGNKKGDRTERNDNLIMAARDIGKCNTNDLAQR